MANITIRNLDDEIKNRLRIRAAQNGRSMEEELRVILQTVTFGESSAREGQIRKSPAGEDSVGGGSVGESLTKDESVKEGKIRKGQAGEDSGAFGSGSEKPSKTYTLSAHEPSEAYSAHSQSLEPIYTGFNDEFGNKITIDSSMRFGKPCINNTRIAVDDVLSWFASGMSMEEILTDFPDLTTEQIKLALKYVATRQTKSITLP